MVLSTWKPLLPLILFVLFSLYEEWVCTPSCNLVTKADLYQHDVVEEENAENLKVMMVANLLLLGSEAGFVDLYFRDYYMSKFFRKSFHSLKPDMLLVLGDVSAKGSELTKSKWVSVLHQFHQMLGPFLELPFHVVLGDRDVGQCSELDAKSVYWIARSFPGLDSAGCGAFEINNVSFVSLNAVALLCGNNKLRFSVEKVIETERVDLRTETNHISEAMDESGNFWETSDSFGWRENAMVSGSGSVLLVHFPLHRTTDDNFREGNTFKKAPSLLQQVSNALDSGGLAATEPYELFHNVPPNATEYLFQALKPRIIFSAHTHEFCDYTHSDGTREVTVPAMTWKVKDNPGFVFSTFQSGSNAISVSYCSLPRESHILIAYTSVVVLLLTILLVANMAFLRCLRR